MRMAISIDGNLTNDPARASIPVFDRGFLYGDSIYEVFRTYQGRLFAVNEHFDRLERSAAAIGLRLPAGREAILKEIEKTVQAAGTAESYVRLVITRGGGDIGLDPALADRPRMIILVKELTLDPKWKSGQGITLKVVNVRRNYKNALSPAIKSGNYLNNVLAIAEAKAAGADDAIMLDFEEKVTESTTSNVFLVKNGVLLTPPLEVGILEGITRKILLRLAGENGIDVSEKDLWLRDLESADEMFLCGTIKEVLPVSALDGKPIGSGRPGPLTMRMSSLFDEFTRRSSL